MNVNEIETLFNDNVEKENFSGVGFVKKGQTVIFHEAYGYAHRGWKVQNTINTKYDTASITKIFTSVAIFQLIDKQLLKLEDKIRDLIDLGESTISKEVTIYHLLTHTSGIADDADEEAGESYEALWKDKPNYSVKETIDYLPQFIYKEPIFKPGEGCRYNNCAYILLGLIIEQISGQPYRQYVKQHIFDVVGMQNTGFHAMDEVVVNAAEHYASIRDEHENHIDYRKNIYAYPSIGASDAGALTTAEDLDLFMRTLRSGGLLSDTLTQEILTPKEEYRKHTSVTEWMGYGFQFLRDNDTKDIIYIQKDGINPGVSCVMNYYPDTDTTIILLANQDTNVWDLAWDIQELLK